MRLSQEEREAIVKTVHEFLPRAEVLLYGSRVDDEKRGGDIDLLILNEEPVGWQTVGDIRYRLWDRIGEQKIDICAERRSELSPFARMVLHHAIPVAA
jgi:predicted nucleotidyltransferase